jgi:hypothetical protein
MSSITFAGLARCTPHVTFFNGRTSVKSSPCFLELTEVDNDKEEEDNETGVVTTFVDKDEGGVELPSFSFD